VVDNVIVALRRAFEEDAWRPRHILNVRGVGYRFVP
jgi:DNA-binding response OmpR family regulator